jgi:predicted secreted hydrolase
MAVILVVAAAVLALVAPGHGEDWKPAAAPWTWVFPRDHGSHPDYRTEWWYFTGNLETRTGAQYGYQLTFFRQGIVPKPAHPGNTWSVRDIYLAHFAVSDIPANRFHHAEHASRTGPDLARAKTDGLHVWLFSWFVRMTDSTIRTFAKDGTMEIDLRLTPKKPVVFHGDRGLDMKGPNRGQASYYYSYTDLETEGRISVPSLASPTAVTGTSWFDHEFGSNQLAEDQVGWDWFSLHLSDGRDLMLYLLRRADGSVEPASSGTLVEPSGGSKHLTLSDITLTVVDRWRSPRSGGIYPSRWRIQIPAAHIDLIVSPLMPNQELTTEGSTGVVYWEGAVEGTGTSGDRDITCKGYVELTGYAGSLGGVF